MFFYELHLNPHLYELAPRLSLSESPRCRHYATPSPLLQRRGADLHITHQGQCSVISVIASCCSIETPMSGTFIHYISPSAILTLAPRVPGHSAFLSSYPGSGHYDMNSRALTLCMRPCKHVYLDTQSPFAQDSFLLPKMPDAQTHMYTRIEGSGAS